MGTFSFEKSLVVLKAFSHVSLFFSPSIVKFVTYLQRATTTKTALCTFLVGRYLSIRIPKNCAFWAPFCSRGKTLFTQKKHGLHSTKYLDKVIKPWSELPTLCFIFVTNRKALTLSCDKYFWDRRIFLRITSYTLLCMYLGTWFYSKRQSYVGMTQSKKMLQSMSFAYLDEVGPLGGVSKYLWTPVN